MVVVCRPMSNATGRLPFSIITIPRESATPFPGYSTYPISVPCKAKMHQVSFFESLV